jgi:hypothetical protein
MLISVDREGKACPLSNYDSATYVMQDQLHAGPVATQRFRNCCD